MLIHNTPLTCNFSKQNNDLVNDETMSATATAILVYLLSKPENWKLRVNDLKRRFNCGSHSIRKALKWLQQAGYIYYHRLTSGHTVWHIFNTPQQVSSQNKPSSPVKSTQTEKPQVENQPVLIIQSKTEILKTPQPEPELTFSKPSENVVVVLDKTELVFPEQLTPPQIKQAKHVIKKCALVLQQEVLFALAYALTKNTVKNPVAYLNGLITRANNGTFEPVNNSKNSPQAIKKPPVELPKVNNDEYFADLIKRYGDRAANAIAQATQQTTIFSRTGG